MTEQLQLRRSHYPTTTAVCCICTEAGADRDPVSEGYYSYRIHSRIHQSHHHYVPWTHYVVALWSTRVLLQDHYPKVRGKSRKIQSPPRASPAQAINRPIRQSTTAIVHSVRNRPAAGRRAGNAFGAKYSVLHGHRNSPRGKREALLLSYTLTSQIRLPGGAGAPGVRLYWALPRSGFCAARL